MTSQWSALPSIMRIRLAAASVFVLFLGACTATAPISDPGPTSTIRPEFSASTPSEPTKSVDPETPSPISTENPGTLGTPYTGAATCTNLINPGSLSDLKSANLSLTSNAYAEKIALENPEGLSVGRFAVTGGLVCGWSTGYNVEVTYTYGPLSDEMRFEVLDTLDELGYKHTNTSGFDKYEPGETTDDAASFAIGDGSWASSHTFGGGDTIDLLEEVVEHAPAWDSPEKLPPVSNEPLPTAAARPASAPYLTTGGIGDLRLNKPVPAKNSFVTWHPDTCFGAWLTKAPYGDYQEGTDAFALYTSDHKKTGALQFILLSDDSIPTKSGVRIGDSEATLLATYDDLEKRDQPDSTLYAVSDDIGQVVFEVAKHNSVVGAYRANQIVGIMASSAARGDITAPSFMAPCTL